MGDIVTVDKGLYKGKVRVKTAGGKLLSVDPSCLELLTSYNPPMNARVQRNRRRTPAPRSQTKPPPMSIKHSNIDLPWVESWIERLKGSGTIPLYDFDWWKEWFGEYAQFAHRGG